MALPIENIDTDQIIPARFLKATNRDGFGKNLFRDWRYMNDDETQPRLDFVLNDPSRTGKILIGGKNFGCGSSREHAAWAIKDAGFDVVISSFFADIFKSNALNNFLLPVQVSESFLSRLFEEARDEKAEFELNLPQQQITICRTGESFEFAISTYKKNCLLNGFDDIDFLLSLQPEIEKYEFLNA